MRMGGRQARVVALCLAGALALTAAVAAGIRWTTSGSPLQVRPPGGASPQLPAGGYETVVDSRVISMNIDVRGRSGAKVDVYAMPPATAWDGLRDEIAGQLGTGWQRRGDCADTGERAVSCIWTEQTRWWPRKVKILFQRRPKPGDETAPTWPEITILIVGAGTAA